MSVPGEQTPAMTPAASAAVYLKSWDAKAYLRQYHIHNPNTRRKFTVIPLPYRHGRTLGGSWHCITLDTNRDGGLENYF